ncbi:MAG: MBL fold metallo-hydrolase [Syntrophotaleaceae bacterium]
MKLTFLGTRGYIEPRTKRHARHSSLLVEYHGRGVMIDCGEDWKDLLPDLRPKALVLTHAHPDHAGGLPKGSPCPVWATGPTWESLDDFPIEDKRVIQPRRPVNIRGIIFEAFAVQHSLRAPAVGFRITAGRASVFYAPDVVYINERREALQGCRLYIGDGATVIRSMVRKQDDQLFGHTPVRTQLTWCRKEAVPRMLVSHCGKEIVEGEKEGILETIAALGDERHIAVEVAYDGMEVILR